jgi:glycosyltransferase involved in cell wall biosynthesis
MGDCKIKVLHICGGGVRSGIEAYVLGLVKAFRNTSINILVAPLRYGVFTEELKEHGLRPIELLKRFRGDPSVFLKLALILKTEKIDIVHTHGENGNFYGRAVAKLMGRKVVSTVHSHLREALVDMSADAWLRTLVYKQDLFFSFLNDRMVATSNRIAAELEQNGVRRGRISVIHSGIDIKADTDWQASFKEGERNHFRVQQGIQKNDFVVGTVGRIAPVKNHSMLIEAAEFALKVRRSMKFMIVGDGPSSKTVRKSIDERGLTPFFILPGWQKDVRPYLGCLDAFVMTSITEGLNITLIQAMAMGIPVISTNVGSISEIIQDGVNGFLVPLEPPNLLADKIMELSNNQLVASRLARKAFSDVAGQFDISVCAAKYERLYETLLGHA